MICNRTDFKCNEKYKKMFSNSLPYFPSLLSAYAEDYGNEPDSKFDAETKNIKARAILETCPGHLLENPVFHRAADRREGPYSPARRSPIAGI